MVAAEAAAAQEAAAPVRNDYLPPSPPLPVGGRLSAFAEEWERVTSDQWVLDTVRHGYRLEFSSPPPRITVKRVTSMPAELEQQRALQEEIDQLLKKSAIQLVPASSILHSSSFFLTTKKSGQWRPILNLKPLNKFMKPRRFKMESLQAILPELTTEWWAASIDLKDAYLHIPIHHSHRKWLGFFIGQSAYQFNCLPFGLATAPRTFTRVVKVIAEHLRRLGHTIFVYLDDWLLVAPSKERLLHSIAETCHLVDKLGFIRNREKSQLTPARRIEFLGATLDFLQGRAFPTQSRVEDTVRCAEELLATDKAPASKWMRLLGLIASMVFILPLCRLRMRTVQLHVLSEFNIRRHPMSTLIPNSASVRKALQWWTCPVNLQQGCPFTSRPSSCTLTTDASKSGWGAHFGKTQMSGVWSPKVAKNHINILELWAIHLALRQILPRVKGRKILVQCDNMSVVSYINKQGGTRSRGLCKQTIKLLLWCHRHDIELQAIHLPGEDNKLADALSRKTSGTLGLSKVRGSSVEWHLLPSVCKMIFRRVERPLIDLFASQANAQLPTYCSWSRDPTAFHQDALSMSWNNISGYAFPPIALIPRVLLKLTQSSNCRILLVCPKWPRQLWFPRLLSLLVATPRILPVREDLIQTAGNPLPMDTIRTISLTVWPLSSSLSERQVFQKKLPIWLERQGEFQPDKLIIRDCGNTTAGAGRRRLIQCEPL